MGNEIIKVAVIGLDSSHSVEFPKRMQAPDCPADQRVGGMKAVSCMSFETPFQDKAGLEKRRRQLEAWGVRVSESFEETVEDCDAVMIIVNDPSLHLEYFKKCAGLGKMIFMDKPLADTAGNAALIRKIASEKKLSVMSCSSLRYLEALERAVAELPDPSHGSFFGPIGKAPAGSSIVWYAVHACEMMQRAFGEGAAAVTTTRHPLGPILTVDYDNGRRGIVELVEGAYCYGGTLRRGGRSAAFAEDGATGYTRLLRHVEKFFRTGATDATIDVASEVTAVLDAAERSFQSGRKETVTV